jgi:hypothetical protein
VASSEIYRDAGEAAWSWVLRQLRDEDGPWLPEVVPDDGPSPPPERTEPSLYVGLGSDVTALRLLAPGSEQVALRRLARVLGEGPRAPVVDRPDQWWAGPAHLRIRQPAPERRALWP